MAQDQHHAPQVLPEFLRHFLSGHNPNRPGNGVDHHANPPPYPPFLHNWHVTGPWHHGGPPHPSGPPRGPHARPPHPFASPSPPGADDGPWDEGDFCGGWYGDTHNGPDHSRPCRCHGLPRQGRHNRRCGQGNDDDTIQQQSCAEQATEKGCTAEGSKDANMPDPEEVVPEDGEFPPPPCGTGHRGGHCYRGRGRCGGRGRQGFSREGRHFPRGNSFDLSGLMRDFIQPLTQTFRDQAERYNRNANDADAESFSPPADVFNTDSTYVLHIALPGAKKEDIGVNWNPDNKTLSVSGVVHRSGDEAFIKGLVSGERRVGMFERSVTLPPEGMTGKDEVDGVGITAKMEDGVLVVVVPKVEKEWTEVRTVDVQ